MSDIRTQLDQELGDAPPSRLDIDAVIGRERRRARRMRAGVVGSAAIAVAGLVAGVVTLTSATAGSRDTSPANPEPTIGAPTTAQTSPRATISAAPPHRPRPLCPSGSPAAEAEPQTGSQQKSLPVGAGPRLTTTLRAAVRAAAGTPRLTGSGWGSVHKPLVFNAGPCDPEYAAMYLASATVRSAGGASLGYLTVGLEYKLVYPDPKDGYREACDWPIEGDITPELACIERTGPHGEIVLALTRYGDTQGTPAATHYDISVFRPDGTVVSVDSGGAGGSRKTPPFTVNQLIEIGLDPGLILTT